MTGEHAERLRAYLAGKVTDRGEAEEVAADVFATAQRVESLAGVDDPMPALLLMARRRSIERERKRTRRAKRGAVELCEADTLAAVAARYGPSADPAEVVTDHDARVAALATVPPEWRARLWRHDVEGESLASIGADVGMSASAVGTALDRYRRAVRAAFDRLGSFGALAWLRRNATAARDRLAPFAASLPAAADCVPAVLVAVVATVTAAAQVPAPTQLAAATTTTAAAEQARALPPPPPPQRPAPSVAPVPLTDPATVPPPGRPAPDAPPIRAALHPGGSFEEHPRTGPEEPDADGYTVEVSTGPAGTRTDAVVIPCDGRPNAQACAVARALPR
jgi:DNA-directed RNA polymerase specialized sigma24 family protein